MGIHSWEMNQSAALLSDGNQSDESLTADASADTEPEEEAQTLEYQGKTYSLKDDLETTLVMGLDKYQEEISDEDTNRNDQQSDFLVLIVTDPHEKTSRMLQINRDTMADVTQLGIFGDDLGTFHQQLCLAHTYGTGNRDSCRNTVKAVRGLLGGVPIDHYVSLTMDAVEALNDAVGGVEVTVQDDFSKTDPTLKEGEKVTLHGQHALNYVQNRVNMNEPTNLDRMERQQQYMMALYQKLKKQDTSDGTFVLKLLNDVTPYMVSDCSLNTLSDVLNTALQYSDDEIETIEGTTEKGKYIEFYPDEQDLQDKVIDLFYTSSGSEK